MINDHLVISITEENSSRPISFTTDINLYFAVVDEDINDISPNFENLVDEVVKVLTNSYNGVNHSTVEIQTTAMGNSTSLVGSNRSVKTSANKGKMSQLMYVSAFKSGFRDRTKPRKMLCTREIVLKSIFHFTETVWKYRFLGKSVLRFTLPELFPGYFCKINRAGIFAKKDVLFGNKNLLPLFMCLAVPDFTTYSPTSHLILTNITSVESMYVPLDSDIYQVNSPPNATRPEKTAIQNMDPHTMTNSSAGNILPLHDFNHSEAAIKPDNGSPVTFQRRNILRNPSNTTDIYFCRRKPAHKENHKENQHTENTKNRPQNLQPVTKDSRRRTISTGLVKTDKDIEIRVFLQNDSTTREPMRTAEMEVLRMICDFDSGRCTLSNPSTTNDAFQVQNQNVNIAEHSLIVPGTTPVKEVLRIIDDFVKDTKHQLPKTQAFTIYLKVEENQFLSFQDITENSTLSAQPISTTLRCFAVTLQPSDQNPYKDTLA